MLAAIIILPEGILQNAHLSKRKKKFQNENKKKIPKCKNAFLLSSK